MAYVKIQPPGVLPLRDEDRQPVIKVISGDTWVVDVNLFNPSNPSEPATPENTVVRISLAETQFENPIWAGTWYSGVMPDTNRDGICHIRIPRRVTKALRRGSYLFSLRASDLLQTTVTTEIQGSFLVEYTPTSDQHSIPYKDGTMQADVAETLELVHNLDEEFQKFREKFDFSGVSRLVESDTLAQVKTECNKILEILKGVNQ